MKKILMAWLVAFVPFCALAQTKEVTVDEGEWKESVTKDPRQMGATLRQKIITLNTGAVTYSIRAATATTPEHTSVRPAEGYLGMPRPSSENWYGGGFMAIALNGKDIGSAPLKTMRAIESGERGALETIWEAPEGAVRVRFVGRPGDDKLFCEIALEPKGKIETLSVRLNCYPSFFTSWNKQKGHRVVESLASKAEEGATFTTDPQKDWALIYYDTVFDFGTGRGEFRGVGPCALLFLPEQIKSGKIKIGDYAVTSEFVVQPEAQAVRMIFWDFNGKTNKEAISYLKGKAAACQKELREISFINRTLAGFEFAKKKAETEALIASAKGTEPLAKKIGEVDAKLGPICEKVQAATAAGGVIPFGLEDEALRLIAEREKLVWQLKFHVLLSD
jgi:hypothetical protein